MGGMDLKAIGKLMAEKPAYADALANALGPVWCPMKGVECRELGDNIFLFSFKQSSGRKKAVEVGPWMFEKSLLIMEEFVRREGWKIVRFFPSRCFVATNFTDRWE